MNKKTSQIALYATILILGFYACNPFRPHRTDSSEKILPPFFSDYGALSERPERWWEAFDNAELNALMQRAFSDNFTIQSAWARLDQTDAAAIKAGVDLYPQASLNASAGSVRLEDSSRDDYVSMLAASYEIDLWGRARSEKTAALMDAKASRCDLEAAAMTVAAELVRLWIEILEQRAQKILLEQQLHANQVYLELVELRFQKAMVSALDVFQQKQAVHRVLAQIPLVEARLRTSHNELALLTGATSSSQVKISGDRMPDLPPLPQTGLPLELIKNRPDVQASLMRLQAADWNMAAARADRLPALRLTARAGYENDDFSALFDNWLVNVAANLTAPLFDGRRRKAEVKRSQAVVAERLIQYQQTLLTAAMEVQNALVREFKQGEHIHSLEKQIKFTRRSLELSRQRYLKGMSDYLPVLTALTSADNLEADMIRSKREMLIYRINLYRTLGGRWTRKLLRKDTNAEHSLENGK
ncbi:TolC family protein [Desulfococcaceae bacterium HSG9]|nr:TolC family protein [Desulfococcaceae bacterium HSG9]